MRTIVGVMLLVSFGCSSEPRRYPVSGEVRYRDGSPAAGALVEFIPDGGPSARASVGDDGTFRLEAVAGRHRVVVGKPGTPDIPAAAVRGHPHKAKTPNAKYLRPETSGLECTVVTEGENTLRATVD